MEVVKGTMYDVYQMISKSETQIIVNPEKNGTGKKRNLQETF